MSKDSHSVPGWGGYHLPGRSDPLSQGLHPLPESEYHLSGGADFLPPRPRSDPVSDPENGVPSWSHLLPGRTDPLSGRADDLCE